MFILIEAKSYAALRALIQVILFSIQCLANYFVIICVVCQSLELFSAS